MKNLADSTNGIKIPTINFRQSQIESDSDDEVNL